MALAADLVNPALALCLIAAGLRARAPVRYWIGVGGGLALVYAVLGLDHALRIWDAWGLDYSTHTALAVSVATSLVRLDRRWLWPVAPALVGYAVLLERLGYHSYADVATAAAVTAPATWLVHRAARKRR